MELSKKMQELVDAITHYRQKLLNEVTGLNEAQLSFKASEDQWSIADILHHLALTDEANAKLAARVLRQAEENGLPPDPTPDATVLNCLDQFRETLRGTKAQAPERVVPRSHLPAEESLARLAAAREGFLSSVHKLAQYDLSTVVYPHPLLGDLNLYQWILIAGAHEGRHAAQVGRIKAQEGFPK